MEQFGIWVAAICTLAIFSFLFKENPFYRLFEHMFLGLTMGFILMKTWTDVLKPMLWDRIVAGFKGVAPYDWLWIIALFIGMLWYFQYSKRYHWISRIAIGLALGAGAGMEFKRRFIIMMPQITASFKPLNSFNNIFFVVTIVAVLTYFFFSFEHKSQIIRKVAQLGRLLLMISFGAFFGNTVMTRFAVFIDRIQFLLIEWLKVAK
ncbi:MAG TPA: hypothetical protein EYP60_04125 [bacterium (Candidatus Stahlbacteria)]|nr:hypothetical protein [Candidatus Stahlbacteria bacterium]